MKRLPLLLLPLLLAAAPAARAGSEALRPYEAEEGFEPRGVLDAAVLGGLEAKGIRPSNLCADAVFLRRVTVDLLGVLPTPIEVERFLGDMEDDKRERLVDALLARDEFADYASLKWCDLLRVKAEFPINLWPNGVQAYHRWVRDSLKANRPYDAFVRDLLTSSGSNFRVPPVNFYRAVQDRSPAGLAAAVALTFMGQRLEKWPEARRKGMAAFFSRVVYKKTAEWKEEVVIHDPAPAPPLEAVFPDGTKVTIPSDDDPREVFADWLLAKGNPYLARAAANRVWSWLMGRGVVHEPDDMRDDNPPSNPALLACLERELVQGGFDLKRLYRTILLSRTYQGSPIPQSDDPQAAALFAYYPVRRLDAEVLIDALVRLDGSGESYMSMVPEPFTLLPDMPRTVLLADGTITSPFLEMFGRPSRDTGLLSERDNEPTDGQRLYLLNSTEIQRRIQRSPWLRQMVRLARGDQAYLIRDIYIAVLARDPTSEEVEAAEGFFRAQGGDAQVGAMDLTWALLNTKEFLYRH